MGAPATTGQLRNNIRDMKIGDYIVASFDCGTKAIGNLGTASTVNGFRPVLIIEEPVSTKALLSFGNTYHSYKNNQWNMVSASAPDESMLISEGNNLSDYDRKMKTFNQTMGSGTVLGSGKMFKSTVDFKKYIEILKIEIK